MTEDNFLELVHQHKAQVYQHTLYLLKNREDAEDITQETFIKAWEHRSKLRPKTVRSWLLKCAQNLCFNLLKRQKFQGAIKKLPPDMRSVIVMRELNGMSFKEIAEVLEQPEGTVKSTAFRARKRLRELLRPYWRNDE